MLRWCATVVVIGSLAGCGSGDADNGGGRVMTDVRHTHYHVHGPGIAHGHTHADFASGGHTHEHDGH